MPSLNEPTLGTVDVLKRSILKPRTESSLNVLAKPQSTNGKRERCQEEEEEEEECERGGLLVIKDYTSTSPKPLTLKPRLLISRCDLPLAYLDTSGVSTATGISRLFSAQIQVLETNDPGLHSQNERRVLITEDKHDGTLFAVERVDHRIYVLCRMVDWISLNDFSCGRLKSPRLQYVAPSQNIPNDTWWKDATIGATKDKEFGESLGRLSWSLSIKLPPGQIPEATTAPERPTSTSNEGPLQPETAPLLADLGTDGGAANAENALDAIRAQYMEALYVSKTSLAYFAKGPLSRARAAYHSQGYTVPKSSELVDYLRSSILSVAMNDKKYNATIPQLIREIPIGVTEDDVDGQVLNAFYKRVGKSKKRKKISKGGLLPGEEAYFIRWWLKWDSSFLSVGPGDSREGRIKLAMKEQRARETQLQIILILETLALECGASQKPISLASAHIPYTEDESDTQRPRRSKKSQDLSTLLDVLVDRLCIWESTDQEEPKARLKDDSDLVIETNDAPVEDSAKDRLRSFCVEVIIPFYATRLPELYMHICCKLGAALPSPPRPKLQKSASSSRITTKPGVASQRPQPKRPRKTLERVLTDERIAARRPQPMLSRSATDSALPSFKRELSEVSLSAVPAYRPTIQNSRRYSQREVDLTAVSQATEAKIQRKAAIEKELKGAIATLKRPNPRMAVKEFVDSADRRTTGFQPKSRKASSPKRNPFGSGVQVMATPKANRQSDFRHNLPALPNTQTAEPEFITRSSDPRIPSSSIRPKATSLFYPRKRNLSRTPSKPILPRLNYTSIKATPSRHTLLPSQTSLGANTVSRSSLGHEHEHDEPSSPELPQFRSNESLFKRSGLSSKTSFTPSKAQRRQFLNESIVEGSIRNTPIKVIVEPAIVTDRPSNRRDINECLEVSPDTKCPKQQAGAQESIYDALGWDDGIDDL